MNLKLNYEITNDLDFREEPTIFEEDGLLTFERDIERVMSLIYSNIVDLVVEEKFITSIYGTEATRERFYYKLTATLMQEEKYDRLYFNYIKDFTRDFIVTYSGMFKDNLFNDIYVDLVEYIESRKVEIPDYYRKRNEVKQLILSFSVEGQPDGVVNSISLLSHYFNTNVLDSFLDGPHFNVEASVLENVSKYIAYSSEERFALNKLLDQDAKAIQLLIKHVVLKPLEDNLDTKYFEMVCNVADEFITTNDDLFLNDIDVVILRFGKVVLEKILDNNVEEYVEETKGLIIRH